MTARNFAACIVCLLWLTGCGTLRTQKAFYAPITQELQRHNFDQVIAQLEAARKSKKFGEKDRLIYFLDAGLARYYAGRYSESNEKLELADQAGEELFTKSISRAALSLMLNDNVLEYAGEDHELLYANLFKALNFIALDSFEAAFVEIRRANRRSDLLEQKYAEAANQFNEGMSKDSNAVKLDFEAKNIRFNNSAFARYLSMHIYAADGKLDDADIDRKLLHEAFITQPHIYNFPEPEVRYFSEEGPILSVVAVAGQSPVKEAVNFRLRTDKQLDLVQILIDGPAGTQAEYGHIPMKIGEDFYFKFAIPKIVQPPSIVSRIEVSANGRYLGGLSLIEDVGGVAQETFEAKKSLVYLRSIARAIAKGLATHRLKERADTGGLGGWLKKAAIDVGSDLTENADLRCARLLPGRIYVGDFELAAGTYDVTIEFFDSGGSLIRRTDLPGYVVLEKGLNMVQACALQ